ncbi:hypothetical protein GOBAR_AA32192 [Gossypium barbadense]|uniref:Uncharacterized protein n=1 Tax=Gossypium barbadense TaxID=3634 RepID=A0A2P5WBM1_GOSBA|nr:hypothetical protein GOBAR_AA32192 [Gossypium barbadense]
MFSNLHGQAHGRALGRAHTMGRDMAMRYDRVETGKNLPPTRDVISCQAVQHGRRQVCQNNTGVGHARVYKPWYTMSTSRGKKIVVLASKKRKGAASSSGPTAEIRHPFIQFPLGPQEEIFQILGLTLRVRYPGTVQFCLGGLVHQLSVYEFRIALGLYTEEFMDDNELDTLYCHIYYSPSKYWKVLVPPRHRLSLHP